MSDLNVKNEQLNDELARLREENERYAKVLHLIADQTNWDTIFAGLLIWQGKV